MTVFRFGRHSVRLSSPDKPMFPEDGLTKGDVVDYYREAAGAMLRHLSDRPVVMQRFPDGIGGSGFYHKDLPSYFPHWVDRVTVEKRQGGTLDHVVCRKAATIVYLANQNCLTLHQWLSRTDSLERPDLLVFDLDPPAGRFDLAVQAAAACRGLLEDLGLRPYLKTSGGKGLHVVVPLDRKLAFAEVRAFADDAAQHLALADPEHLTTEFRIEKRGGRLFLDTGRNAYGQHVVAPYSLRPFPGAPVAMPLDWEELEEVDPRQFTAATALDRIRATGDPWTGMRKHARSLRAPGRRLAKNRA